MAGEIFISYRRADQAWARLLCEQLKAEGVDAWYDAHVGPGQDWRVATAKALEDSRIFVLLFSANAAQSSDIAKELAAAVLEKKLIVPVRLENIAPKGAFLYELASRNWINAYDDTGARLAELAKALAQLVKTGARDVSVLPFVPVEDKGASPRKWLRPRAVVAAAGLALLAVAALLFWPHAKPLPTGSPPAVAVRIAVQPFAVLGDDSALRQFAGGLQTEIVEGLSQSQVPVVSPQDSTDLKGQGAAANATRLHIAYLFGGTIEHRGKDFLVRAHLDDARQSVTVWSHEFSGDAADPGLLQKEIAALASQVGDSAHAYDHLANGDTDAMSLLIKSDQFSTSNRPQDREAEWNNMKQLVERFPQVAAFHSNFAIISAFLAINSRPSRAKELRDITRTQAPRALALNPQDSIAYLAQVLVFPSVGNWASREKLLLRGLKALSRAAALHNHESNLLRETGRLKDAVTYGRQAQVPVPFSANRDATLLLAFAAAGNSFEGDPLAQRVAKSWPRHPAAWNARLELALFNSRWDDALALLAPGGYVPIPDAVAGAWRSALTALKSGNVAAKREAARQIVSQLDPTLVWASPLPNEEASPGGMIGLLAMLGDRDAAFAAATAYLKRDTYADASFLFWPTLADLRRDPRFMPLVASIGLVDYWRSSGNWPDFCIGASRPYDCQAEAKQLKL